jgi:methylmalonyl-CoA/ethylmalonyl-CoA epimerase
MDKYLLATETDCTAPSREEEYMKWFDDVLIIDILQNSGETRATHYANIDPEGNRLPKYLALAEIETDDINKTNATLIERTEAIVKKGLANDLMVLRSSRLYRQIMAPKESGQVSGKMDKYLLVTETDCADPSREEEYMRWFDNVHVRDFLKNPGVIRATRFVNLASEGNKHSKYLAMYEIESNDIHKTDALFIERRKTLIKEGHSSELMVPRSRCLYKQITTQKESRKVSGKMSSLLAAETDLDDPSRDGGNMGSIFNNFEHVGVVVRDLEKTIEYLTSLGIGPFKYRDGAATDEKRFNGKPAEWKTKATITSMGKIDLVLLQPIEGESPWKEFLESKGEGIHHICFRVENIEEEINKLTSKGVKIIASGKGKTGGGFAYLATDVLGGIIIELTQ